MSEQNDIKQCGCQQEGLAIFPTRYTVVPTYIKTSCPSWANLTDVTKIQLNDDYQYHIRRVRAGFIYIYLPSNVTASNEANNSLSESAQADLENRYWLIYSVDEQGRFIKQNNIQSVKTAEPEDDAFKCPNLEKNPTLNTFITIPNPSRYSKVYIAYSEFPWTVEAMQEYRKNPLPRMQEIDITAWQSQQYNQISATVATEQTISEILDFNHSFLLTNSLPDYKVDDIYGAHSVNNMSAPLWLYKNKPSMLLNNDYEKITRLNTTEQPWIPFKTSSPAAELDNDADLYKLHIQQLHKTMQNYSGDHGSPMILAIEDALGIALDLSNYYNDVFAHLGQFHKEAKMELDVKQYMNVVRSYVEYQESQKDFSFSPAKDELYIATANKTSLANVDYINQISLSKIKDISVNEYESIEIYNKHKIEDKFPAARIMLPTHPDISSSKAPINRNYYQLVRSYILLVKEHFYGKPYGRNYYQRFMNYLKFYDSSEKPYIIYDLYRRDEFLIDDSYTSDSIYAKALKYASFNHEAPISEIKSDSQLMHKTYEKLVEEYEKRADELKKQLTTNVDNKLKKYTECLQSEQFDAINQKIEDQVELISNERAKQLIKWLKESHYLTVINDLSYEQNIELDPNSPDWAECYAKIEKELQESLEKGEIEDYEIERLRKVNLNGFYFTSVVNRTLQGLDLTIEGKAFIEELSDIEKFASVEGEAYIHIRTSLKWLLYRTLSHDWNLTYQVLCDIYNIVDKNAIVAYGIGKLEDITIFGLSLLTTQFRTATLVLEHIMELKKLQKVEGLTTIAIDTNFGKRSLITRWFANYDNPALTLKLYDKLIACCKPIGKGLYSLGAVIAEAAALALSGVVWQTATVYAHMKYQVMEAWVTFKSGCAERNLLVNGRLQVFLSTYPAKAKQLIKQLRDNLNMTIKQLDGRFAEQLVELDHMFKKNLNIVFKVFSDAATDRVTHSQIHLRSARLAFLVGAFEVYNWQYIMQKEPSLFASDSDILLEKAIASSSLAAAVADTIAYTIRARNRRAILGFRRAKVGFGVFTAFATFLTAAEALKGSLDNFEYNNKWAGFTGLASFGMHTTSGGLYLLYGLSYRYEWVQTLFKVKIRKFILRKSLQQAFNLVACRLLLFRFGGIIGVAAMFTYWVYELVADDDIQIHLKFSAIGLKKDEHKYYDAADQLNKFKSIDQLKGLFVEETSSTQTPQDKQQAKQETEQKSLVHETIMSQIESYVIKWLT
ncbi:T6SS effector BTH_I2691 family protein [uncultured Gilliamella sp.]|uniref:T6SS effector BTH_I2691 family protein n=1 Tax=uncultured Gilliamella sp. TaxID=1193505 RepID=UPI0025F75DBE|nr:T6SS effector BTH_I2691 family protein [uncultured Gilliamella sp.]